MKRLLVYVITLCLLLSLALPVLAAENGTCGEGLTWTLEGTTLTIGRQTSVVLR